MDVARPNWLRRWRTGVIGACIGAVLIACGLALASSVQKSRVAAWRTADL